MPEMKRYSCILTDYSECKNMGFKEKKPLSGEYKWVSGDIDSEIIKSQYGMLSNIKEKVKESNNILVLGEIGKDKNINIFDVDEYQKIIKTNSYVGVVKYIDNEKEVKIEIRSRFDKNNPSQDFLMYIIEKTRGIFIPQLSTDILYDNYWSIVLTIIFVLQLKEAYIQGLFKTYVRFKYNDPNIKGTININRHIKTNTPFMGNVAYDLRENSEDNYIIYLIRHAYERLRIKYPEIVAGIIQNNPICNEAILAIEQNSKNFHSVSIEDVVKLATKKINHPYFSKYEPLRKTCIMVLRDMGINIFDGSSELIYGILMPIDKLWEKFVGSEIIKKVDSNFEHHGKSDQKPLIVRTKNKRCVKKREFDFYLPGIMNIDAKYKPRWENAAKSSWRNEYGEWATLDKDIYQILAYMFVSNIKLGGAIFPSTYDKDIPDFKTDEFEIMTEENSYNRFYTIPVIIPNEKDTFKNDFENNLQKVRNDIKHMTRV